MKEKKTYCDSLADLDIESNDTSLDASLLLQDLKKPRRRSTYDSWSPLGLSISLHSAILFLLGTGWILLLYFYGYEFPYGVSLMHSPARTAVEYKRVEFFNNLEDTNAFKGEPRPELDLAWGSILRYRNVAVPDSQLGKGASIKLNDGTGRVLFNLDVFHNLHCLNMVRRYLFRNYYYPNGIDGHDQQSYLEQINHCIDLIRQSLMCHADIAITTYSWKLDYHHPWPDFHIDHECRNWDNILEWSKDNHVPILKGDILKHPTFGAVYPEDVKA